ncbi:DUF2336 domain-containing protein [Pannonibacter tanglangensis]|uniref:DUF2336 domain-containing protein n=1 Tax=Pannonibacter tanglangensis TaxID=2750084 RepID=A0ABW9ZDJ9_9HYPH|nr:DUF2336 domain-containing protein [Pannonibacter sp. XCT-34]NBN62915.1 DUF2336 domain-containing protein [Pannonibacter sp. XCT-34]
MSPVPPSRDLDRPAPDPDLIRKDRLLLAATELFCARERHDRSEQKAFGELALQLYDATSLADRRRVACLLARASGVPSAVLARLADDADALVAYPVLLHAPQLDQDVLARVAGRGPESLRRAILRRADLAAPALAILAAEAEPDTLIALADRRPDELDDTVLEALCRRPAVMDRLGPLLAERNLLPSDLLLARFPTLDPVNRQRALAAAGLRALADRARQGPPRLPRPLLSSALLQKLSATALACGPEAFAGDLSRLLDLDGDFSLSIVADASGESLAVALKALGMPAADTASILVRLAGASLSLEALRAALRLHETLGLAAAQLLVATWRQHAPAEGTATATGAATTPVRAGAESRAASPVAGLRGSDGGITQPQPLPQSQPQSVPQSQPVAGAQPQTALPASRGGTRQAS